MIRGVLVGAALTVAAFYAPDAYQGIHAWLYPTPEQAAAQAQARVERQAQQLAEVRADAERRSAGVNGNLAARHPGCTFDDLGGYRSPDNVMHPVLAIFCPGQTVTVNTTREEKVTEGKVQHTYERPESVTTDAPTQEQPQ